METVTDVTFLGSKITADGDCSHEIKRHLILGRKTMIKLDSILKRRDISLSTKAHLVKAMVFPVVMYRCECWTIKKPKHWRTDVFELWHWRRLLSPLDCKEIKPGHQRKSVLNIHWKDWCWSWNSSTLATWCEELTHLKKPWCWERLKVGGEGDDRGWDCWMASSTPWIWVSVNSRSWWWTGRPGVLQSMGLQSQTRLSDWTEAYPRTTVNYLDLTKAISLVYLVWLKIWESSTPLLTTACCYFGILFFIDTYYLNVSLDSCKFLL